MEPDVGHVTVKRQRTLQKLQVHAARDTIGHLICGGTTVPIYDIIGGVFSKPGSACCTAEGIEMAGKLPTKKSRFAESVRGPFEVTLTRYIVKHA